MSPIFSPFPTLETSRLLLRRFTDADIPDMFEMRSDPEVMRYIPRPLAQTHDDVRNLIQMINDFADKGERINWAVEWKATGKVVAMIGFVNIKPEHQRAEVGYSVNREWYRRGITRESLAAVIEYGFTTMQLHSVEAQLDAENIPSENVLIDAGFRREALFIEDFFYNGEYRNSLHYGLLKREWESRLK